MIGIVNLGISNIFSICNAVKYLTNKTKVLEKPKDFLGLNGIILPGVGSFKEGINSLKKKKINNLLIKFANDEIPILGICLGMQLLADRGVEGGINKGLGLISGEIKKLNHKFCPKIPNIGWHQINVHKPDYLLNSENLTFYFLHSYYFHCKEKTNVLATIKLLNNDITVAVKKKNIYGLQYHPEKSLDAGMNNLHSFIKICN